MFIFDLLQRVWKMDGMDEMMMVLLSRCFYPFKSDFDHINDKA